MTARPQQTSSGRVCSAIAWMRPSGIMRPPTDRSRSPRAPGPSAGPWTASRVRVAVRRPRPIANLSVVRFEVPALANALVPFLVFVTTLPRVAVAPLPLLWLGYGIARILKHLRLVAARQITAVARGSSRATSPS
jgi:hypothetical protein